MLFFLLFCNWYGWFLCSDIEEGVGQCYVLYIFGQIVVDDEVYWYFDVFVGLQYLLGEIEVFGFVEVGGGFGWGDVWDGLCSYWFVVWVVCVEYYLVYCVGMYY